jgi:hypothetical protein
VLASARAEQPGLGRRQPSVGGMWPDVIIAGPRALEQAPRVGEVSKISSFSSLSRNGIARHSPDGARLTADKLPRPIFGQWERICGGGCPGVGATSRGTARLRVPRVTPPKGGCIACVRYRGYYLLRRPGLTQTHRDTTFKQLGGASPSWWLQIESAPLPRQKRGERYDASFPDRVAVARGVGR